MNSDASPDEVASVQLSGIALYWLPLGAGGHSVRFNGLVFEAIAARLQHRDRSDFYHSALEVCVPEGRFVVEQAPAWGESGERGVVAEGPVGTRAAGRFRVFRYEVRRWRDGVIPDVAEAVESPQRLSDDPEHARRLLELVPEVATPVWGCDELGAGEMWNSNSLISWLIARTGLDVESIRLPAGGRAPGWRAGIVMAQPESAEEASTAGQTAPAHQIKTADPVDRPLNEPLLECEGSIGSRPLDVDTEATARASASSLTDQPPGH
jgi:hypothetical protein